LTPPPAPNRRPDAIVSKPRLNEPFATQQKASAEPVREDAAPPDLVNGREAKVSVRPTIDLEAARGSARRMAGETPALTKGLAGQPYPAPVAEAEKETSLGRTIAKTTRPDCIARFSGAGLFAPFFHAYHLATDKKDTGCRY
jgi:hypothetical protein